MTVEFALDGTSYAIDLSNSNADKLRKALNPWTQSARRMTGQRGASGGTRARTDKEQLSAMRQWARDNGYELSDRGRVSKQIQDAYNASG